MSAWYILSAMGFYPVTPGSDIYVIGTPLFPETVIDVGNGRTFTIKAADVSAQNIYIQSAALNGKPLTTSWFRHRDIMKGGTLEFVMGPEPNTNWGSSDSDLPHSAVTEHLILPVPFVSSGSRVFAGSTQVALGSIIPSDIYYTLNGTPPTTASTRYTAPFTITESVTLKAAAFKEGMPESMVLTAQFDKIHGDRDIQLNTVFSSQYSAGGDKALIDGIRGNDNFRTGSWQGYHGVDIDAVVDLGKIKNVRTVSIGFLQDNDAWVFMPEKVEFLLSKDGDHFSTAAIVPNIIPHKQEGTIQKDFTARIDTTRARYIKIHAKNIGTCPPWHKGVGKNAWIFADEIMIE